MKIINVRKLDKFYEVFVDDCDYERISKLRWWIIKGHNTNYAAGRTNYCKRKRVQMHHLILGFPDKGLEVDHINGNGLDNQKSNLRFVSKRQNINNRHSAKKYSKYTGVSFHKIRRKFITKITVNRKTKHLGYFNTDIDAFIAYKKAVHEITGEEILGYEG